MRKSCATLFVMTLFLLSACAGNGARNAVSENSNIAPQSNSDRGKAVLQLGGGTVSVDYGRPALKGRDLEKLIERGQEWRMGSNAPTTLETDIDLKFGDQTIPKGKYFLKAKPVEQQEWVMLIQTPDNTTVAEAPLSFQKVDPSLELLTIELAEKNNGGTLMLHWGNLALSTDFQKA